MGKLLHRQNEYIVIEEENGRGVVLVNTKGIYKNHGHIGSLKTAKMMIDLIERRIIPKSDYLRITAKRVSLDEDYVQAVQRKIEKDKEKPKYCNINKGINKK